MNRVFWLTFVLGIALLVRTPHSVRAQQDTLPPLPTGSNKAGTATLDLSQFSGVTQFDIEYTGTGYDLGLGNISYQIPLQSKVEIAIYNMLGEEIRVLVNDNQSAGSYTIVWDGKNREGFYVSSGIYIYRIKTEGFVKSKKMLLLK